MKVLFLAPINFNYDIKKKLKREFKIDFLYGLKKNKLIKIIPKYHVLITNPGSTYKFDEKILKGARKLKLIITPSTGTDHINYEYCLKNKIRIRCLLHNRKILNKISASAEFTLFLILLTLRKFNKMNKISLNGSWRKNEDQFRGNEIQGKTIGIVGYGRIGKKLNKYLKSLDCKIKVYDPLIKQKSRKIDFVNSLSLIFKNCDIITLNLTLNKNTTGLIDKRYLNILKKNQILINTSRGKIVDEDLIIKKIKQNKFFYTTDVISDEFKDNLHKNKLLRLSNNFIVEELNFFKKKFLLS